jgi:lipopolysaccharide transport system ATP-binding protein
MEIMSETAIKIENLSKQYRLGLVGTGTLSHDLKRWWTVNLRGQEDPYLKIGDMNDRSSKGTSDYIWALKDINLEIEQGDVVGIIGRNGAGKSTLLKILSRVTKPTTGKIHYKGRIASLLEVGTGFHPELTGRENIFMNGVIMGMTRAEISRKLDEIIDFSGVERYIDTPVKRYSSGMTVRLGFSIAAHLEPDILVVDEVLAVGDAEFQKKAIGKMQDVSRGKGRTVLFVSHNMAAIRDLCDRAVLLKNGLIDGIGDTKQIIQKYFDQNRYAKQNQVQGRTTIMEVKLTDESGNEINHISEERECLVHFKIYNQDQNIIKLGFTLFNSDYFGLISGLSSDNNISIPEGESIVTVKIPVNLLHSDTYIIEGALFNETEIYFQNDNLLSFEKVGSDDLSRRGEKSKGLLRMETMWYIRK